MSTFQCDQMSPTPRHSRFAVVIPVFNHGATIAAVARTALRQNLPVIVVDDGSTDNTNANISSVRGIHLMKHEVNQGKGAALLTGMQEAAKVADWAICLDADGQHDPNDIGKLMAAIPGSMRPIVIGRRQGMKSAPWTSRFGRGFSNFWVWLSGAEFLSDTQSGFRAYPLPEVLTLDIKARRYQFEIEILAKAAWQCISAIEVPVEVDYQPQGRRISHFHPLRDFVRNTQTFARLITRRVFTPRLWKRPRKYRS